MDQQDRSGNTPEIEVGTAVVHVKAVITEVDDSLLTTATQGVRTSISTPTDTGRHTPVDDAPSLSDQRTASSVFSEAQMMRVMTDIRDLLEDISAHLIAYMELGN